MIIREWSVDCFGCRGNLDDAGALEQALQRGADRVGATVLGASTTAYQPIGTTVFVPLAESHAMVSTWPEHRYALVSILLCNDRMDPAAVLESVTAVLLPERVETRVLQHPVG